MKDNGIIIVDAENISKELFIIAISWMKYKKYYKAGNMYIFGNMNNIPIKFYRKYTSSHFVDTFAGKNVADTCMSCFIMQVLYERNDISTIFLLSQDRDMSYAIKMASEFGKCVVSITEKNHKLSNLNSVDADMLYVEQRQFET